MSLYLIAWISGEKKKEKNQNKKPNNNEAEQDFVHLLIFGNKFLTSVWALYAFQKYIWS